MEDTEAVLKACIVAHKGGVPTGQLDNVFFKVTGKYIPYLKLGYSSLYEYLGTIKDLFKERNENSELVYKVATPKVAHLVKMVEAQKDSAGGTRSSRLNPPPSNKEASRNWKRKATSQGRSLRKSQKRQKNEAKTRVRDWNRAYDRMSLDGDDCRTDSPWDISDYEHWYEEEFNHPVKIMEKPQKMDVISEPIVNGKLLIGDDFFLQLAIRNIGTTIWRKGLKTPLHNGLCVSGQTIKDCTRTLSKVQAVANKVVILLGAEDIYRGHSSEQMIEDMEDMLDQLETRFALSRSAITLCTLPPLANLARNCHRQQLTALHRFNNWIREQTNGSFLVGDWNPSTRYNLIEFFYNNTDAQVSTAYDYFQMDARMVSGSSHPYVLWNLRGRRLAMTLLRGGSC